jgi:hypothetical protein
MKNIMILVMVFLVSSCSTINNKVFITKKLPMANVNKMYSAEIEMIDFPIIQDTFHIESNLQKSNGLKVVKFKGKEYQEHTITGIEGIPKFSGVYYIRIYGVGRSVVKEFDKVYKLEVFD